MKVSSFATSAASPSLKKPMIWSSTCQATSPTSLSAGAFYILNLQEEQKAKW